MALTAKVRVLNKAMSMPIASAGERVVAHGAHHGAADAAAEQDWQVSTKATAPMARLNR